MAAVTALRQTIASALTNDGVWSVFSYVPATPIACSVVVAPDDPYLSPSNNSYNTVSPLANFIIKLYVPLADNQGALQMIEEYMVAAFNKLSASAIKYKIGTLSGVSVDTTAGDLLTADLRISVLTSWE
jgi:hypothetical protein